MAIEAAIERTGISLDEISFEAFPFAGIMLLVLIVLCSLFHRSRSCSCGSVCLRLCR